ncbi:hypothetical protein PABG_12312 [Paracoccidioides brasiliensis Pb03]|nr:hypothetical protein PABG_12312 [Paracoccidioides brasiliensis Pb03]
MFASKRLSKMQSSLPPGISIVKAENLEEWQMDIQAPEVQFISLTSPPSQTPRPIPIHPHIYSNGIICLDLLGTAWSPVQTVESVCMSIQSMLAGNTKNERPPGDAEFVAMNRQRPRDIRFFYDDSTV